jgi:cell wall-associated NlpC family hydrolase
LENQVLTLRLTDTVRELRADLLREKEAKRRLLVQCDALQDSLSAQETAVSHWAAQETALTATIARLEHAQTRQAQAQATAAEQHQWMQRQWEQTQRESQVAGDTHIATTRALQELQHEQQYWREYTHGLELALKETTQQSQVLERLLAEEKQRSGSWETAVEAVQRRSALLLRQWVSSLELHALEALFQQQQQWGDTKSVDTIFDQWELLLQATQ